MKTSSYLLVAGLVFIAGNYSLVYAVENEHAVEAEQHLEQAIESGKAGDTKSEAVHVEEAEKQLIQENKEKPFSHPIKHISGDAQKAQHDEAAFQEMEKAKSLAKGGHAKQANNAAKKAETEIHEKEQSK